MFLLIENLHVTVLFRRVGGPGMQQLKLVRNQVWSYENKICRRNWVPFPVSFVSSFSQFMIQVREYLQLAKDQISEIIAENWHWPSGQSSQVSNQMRQIFVHLAAEYDRVRYLPSMY